MRKQDDAITLSKEQRAEAAVKIRQYMDENFEIDTGNLRSELFVDFISENLGAYFYNKAVADSMTFMNEKVEDLYLLMKD